MIAKTYHGLEDVLAKELLQLGAQDIKTLRRAVKFKGDLGSLKLDDFVSNIKKEISARLL